MTAKDHNNKPEKLSKGADEGLVLKVLVADDDVTNRLVLQGILNSQGYKIFHAENGREAIEVFEKENPDLVLMDVMMPVMDGYGATSEIKRRCKDRFVPVIFLTAITEEGALAKCIEAGGDDFLTKPYNHVILKARINALLRIRDLYNTNLKQKDEIKLHQDRMRREAEMAETLFSNIIKSDALEKPYIKHLLSPMSLFNGDVLIAAEKPSGGINILLGDFTGHGMAAATGALPASSVFYEMTKKGFSVAEIATEINFKMKEILPVGMFLAACILDVDPVTRTVGIWCGGVPDVLMFSKSENKIVRRISSKHLPMGIVDSTQFDNRVEIIEVCDGDRFYVYSDGVVEATNPDNEMFGQKRLEAIFDAGDSRGNIFENIGDALEIFRDGKEQTDDVTLVEVMYDEDLLNYNENLSKTEGKAILPSSHWKVSLEFEADVLRYGDPLPVAVQSITELQGLVSCRQQIYMLLSEMYSNSLEHGLLGLDSKMKETSEGFSQYYQEREKRLAELTEGSIKIYVTHEPTEMGGRLVLRVEDSGPGFNYKGGEIALEENVGHYGRGVPLLQSMCESITHYGEGNIVEAVYLW